jgi:ATP-dependent Lon protease
VLPIEFDYRVLSNLPFPSDIGVKRVLNVLNAMVARRVLPYFRTRRKVDPIRLTRVSERYSISRLEDFHERVKTVSLLSHSLDGWTIQIHERIFDYLALVIPKDPNAGLVSGGQEGREALAFAELLLRHELEHMVYPERSEREVIVSDAEFAMDQRERDPTYYGTLRDALAEEMNGLQGQLYLRLFDCYEADEPADDHDLLDQIIDGHVVRLANAPLSLLRGAFSTTGRELKTRIIAACHGRTTDPGQPLFQRTISLRKLLGLLLHLLDRDRSEAATIIKLLDQTMGIPSILREIGVAESELSNRSFEELLDILGQRLRHLSAEEGEIAAGLKEKARPAKDAEPEQEPEQRTLKDRIEVARADPLIPRSVLTVIDRNRGSLYGHSRAKYTEFIETLLAVPWGKVHRITVSPEEFTMGLDSTHLGLDRPKEMIADFFSNLIWRYRRFSPESVSEWQRSGSSFLFVGPPGVGKTSLAISIARSLGIPYHKISLGGMRDESDLLGHGFTYEGSKPGAIVQGLIKMDVMNGMFILDEADKTEKFAIATLLEILDPEQNHLFHDKYISTTVDVDLSNCHFILTANTLETVPPPVVNRCQVVILSRYSVDEKIAIARQHLLPRVRHQYGLDGGEIYLEPGAEEEHLRHLIQHYTHEAGVRQLERLLRTLLLRVQRKEMFGKGLSEVCITRRLIKQYLEEPARPRRINDEDRIGEVMGLGVDVEAGIGVVIPIQATRIHGGSAEGASAMSMVHATGNIEKVMDESRKVATTGILHCAEQLGIDPTRVEEPVHLHFMGGSTRKDGPSAGGAIALALASLLRGHKLRRDLAMTGEIDTHGRITGVGGLDVKLETAISAGCKTVIVPAENLHGPGGIEKFPEALKQELQILSFDQWQGEHEPFDYTRQVLQVVAVDHISQAWDVAIVDDDALATITEELQAGTQKAAHRLAAGRRSTHRHTLAILAKDTDALDPEMFEPPLCQEECGCWLLVQPPAFATISARLSWLSPQVRVHQFNPQSEDLAQVLREILGSSAPAQGGQELALIAPYFAIKQLVDLQPAGSDAEGSDHLRDLPGVRLFANNYTVQGVKLKRSKPLLNRAYYRLLLLGPEALERCPFVARQGPVHVADLSPIPERYRLDRDRAEILLKQWFEEWLSAMETGS